MEAVRGIGGFMSTALRFSDRLYAGEQLAQSIKVALLELNAAGISAQPIIYALPRGGIPVAVPVAVVLGCPLDIIVAKKITQPENPELAIGAVTSDGHVLWSDLKLWRTKDDLDLRETALHQAQNKARFQLEQFSSYCVSANPQGGIAILIDDGIATGMTIAVAALALKAQQPAQIWLCSPVAPLGIVPWLQQWGDRVIILETPTSFFSVSRFYLKFHQVETEEAITYLQQHNQQFFTQSQIPDYPTS